MFLNPVHKLTKRYADCFSYLNTIRKCTFDYFFLQFGFHLMFYALALDKGEGAKEAVMVDFSVYTLAAAPQARARVSAGPTDRGARLRTRPLAGLTLPAPSMCD